ncbi:MAG: hypothetical protein JO339_28560 [Alphaproteobacteria bacterium]|nr:hypothetical protein [Alphaproteobacteria bacterium]
MTQPANALVAWNPRLALDLPLLVVLFFHGQEPDPQNFAWTDHRLPDQIGAAAKNVVLIAPTMRMTKPVKGDVICDYLATPDSIVTLLREGVAAVTRQLGGTGDAAWIARAVAGAGVHLVPYSNGYRAWAAIVKTLRAPPPPGIALPPVIGHSAFDCLYWSSPLMDGVDCHAPAANARFSANGKALLDRAFVTTHFTEGNETLVRQATYLDVMIAHATALHEHPNLPVRLGPGDIARTVAATDKHLQAVSADSNLSRVVAAAPGFDLPAARPSV